MDNFFKTAGHSQSMTASEWYEDYEDYVDWDFWEDLSAQEVLYVGGVHDRTKDQPAIALHKVTFTTAYRTALVAQNLGVHFSPEEAMKAAGIGHFHKVASDIYNCFAEESAATCL